MKPTLVALPFVDLPYLLPYVRTQHMLKIVVETLWDRTTWSLVQRRVPEMITMRDEIARDGWWN